MVDDAGSGPVGPEGQVAIILYIHYGLNQGIPMQYFPSSTDPDDMDGADEVRRGLLPGVVVVAVVREWRRHTGW